MEKKTRELNYDILRIVACIAVILIHISAIYYYSIYDSSYFGQTYDSNSFIIVILNVLGNFAVPCFVMLTGTFVLSNDKNQDRRYLYKKAIKNILVPTIIIGIIYFIYKEGVTINNIIHQKENLINITYPLKILIFGEPCYHMWYMSMLIGLYIIIPDIIKYTRKIERHKKSSTIFAIIILYLLICGHFDTSKLKYSVAIFIPYISYLLLGYLIRKGTINKKNNKKAMLFIMVAIAIMFVHSFLVNEFHLWNQENELVLGLFGKGAFSPLIILSSCCLFIGFSYMKIDSKFSFKRLPQETLYIYLFHVLVIETISKPIIYKVGMKLTPLVAIPLYVMLTFIISWIITKIYMWLFSKINKDYKLENKIYKILNLEKNN